MTWLNGPLAAFDLETTGTDVEEDRIVTACVGFAERPGSWNAQSFLINPGIPIPPEATAVHGITNEAAANGKQPAETVGYLQYLLHLAWQKGAPVIIYNAVYDLSLLDRELRRHVGKPLRIEGPIIDPLVLDKIVDKYRRGSRKLFDVCQHYGVLIPAEDMHSANADANAALRLAWKIISTGVIPGNPGTDYEDHPLRDLPLDYLHSLQAAAYQEQRKSFHAYLARKGEQPDDDNISWPLKPWKEPAHAN